MKKIRIGSRDSRLAVVQAQIIINMIHQFAPDIQTELVTMKTTGDKILDRTLDKIGGKGLFVKELDRALSGGRVDITVHSLKDVPMTVDERLPLAAFTKCRSPYDVLVLPKNKDIIDLSKPIGSSSARRCLQLKKIYPNAVFAPVRGNVYTRLEKLDRGDYSALVLAQAGLERLGLSDRISRVFTSDEVIPAAGQGVLAVQKRQGEKYDFLDFINDENTCLCAMAERAFVRTLDGGCSSPAAAHGIITGDDIVLTGFYACGEYAVTKKISGSRFDAEKLGQKLASEVLEEADI